MRSDIQVNKIFSNLPWWCPSSSSFEKAELTNHSTYEPEILHVKRFSSMLVHRHIIYSLTLLLLVKQLIMEQYIMTTGTTSLRSGPGHMGTSSEFEIEPSSGIYKSLEVFIPSSIYVSLGVFINP